MRSFSNDLEALNQRFSYHCAGIPLWTYNERDSTVLKGDPQRLAAALRLWRTQINAMIVPGGIKALIVDKTSSEVKNYEQHTMIDEEDWEELATDHSGTARLASDPKVQVKFIEYVGQELELNRLRDYQRHRELLVKIFQDVKVDQYLLTPEVQGEKVVNVDVQMKQTSIKNFVESGPLQQDSYYWSPIDHEARDFADASNPVNDTLRDRPIPIITAPMERRISAEVAPSKTDTTAPRKTSNAPSKSSATAKPSTVQRRISMSRRNSLTDEDEPPVMKRSAPASHLEPVAPVPIKDPQASKTFLEDSNQDGLSIPRTLTPLQLPDSRPDNQKRHFIGSFRWYHVPHCVPNWVPLIMSILSTEKKTPGLYKQILRDELWTEHHNNPTHDSFHGQFIHPFSKELIPKHLHFSSDELFSPSSATQHAQFVSFFPYLHWDSFEQMNRRKDIIDLRSRVEDDAENRQRGVRPVDLGVLNGECTEHKVIWQYLTSATPMHCRRTLDQFGYPSLRRTDARDRDQVLYKYMLDREQPMLAARSRPKLKEELMNDAEDDEEETLSPLAVLMVDTLWLWILADDTILTFAPRREQYKGETEQYAFHADPIKHVLRSLAEDKVAEVQDPFDLAALIIYYCVEALLKGSSESNLKVFRVFEGYTSDLIEKQTDAFKKFRGELIEKKEPDIWKPFRTRAKKSPDQPKIYLGKDSDHGEDLNNLLELRDIADELKIIHTLLDQQLEQVENMIAQYSKIIQRCKQGAQGREFLQAAKRRVEEYQKQVKTLDESCKQSINDYKDLLNLKEAHSGVEEARIASEQARTVTIFTIITIIFSPLSFLASIFGMNVYDWSGTPQNPDLGEALKIILATSFSVIVVLLLVAFNRIARQFVFAVADVLIISLLRTRRFLYYTFSTNRLSRKRSKKVASRKNTGEEGEEGIKMKRRDVEHLRRKLSSFFEGSEKEGEVDAERGPNGDAVKVRRLSPFRSRRKDDN